MVSEHMQPGTIRIYSYISNLSIVSLQIVLLVRLIGIDFRAISKAQRASLRCVYSILQVSLFSAASSLSTTRC